MITAPQRRALEAMERGALTRGDCVWHDSSGGRVALITVNALRERQFARLLEQRMKVVITAAGLRALDLDAVQCKSCKMFGPLPNGCVSDTDCPFRRKPRNRRKPHQSLIRKPWLDTELALLRRDYPHMRTDVIAKKLGRSLACVHNKARLLGITKTDELKRELGLERAADPRNMRGRFKPGITPWQKGRQMPIVGRMRETMFKPGNHPPCKKPIGTYTIVDGVLEQKVADTGRRATDWVPVHRLVWIEAHGKIPHRHIVRFKPRCATTDVAAITLDAIELVSMNDVIAASRPENRYPDELVQVIRLTTAIKRRLNRVEKHREEQDRASTQSPVRDTRVPQGQERADGARARLRRGRRGKRDHRDGQGRSPLSRAHR